MPDLRYDDDAGGAFDPDDFGRLVRVDDYDAYDDDDIDEGEAPLTPDEASRTIAVLTDEREDVRERIEDRRRYGATEDSLAADLRLLDLLSHQLRAAHEDWREAEVAERRRELETARHPAPSPPDRWRLALREAVAPEDLALYDARRAGVSQTKLARDLGISQGAVSKREARIVAEVRALHLKLTGRPLASLEGKRRPGVRGMGRNIPGSR